MNAKQLEQVEALLNGQRRYKLLDCDRKDVLRLKGARLALWLAHYMNENDDQESWLKHETLMGLTGLSKPTIIAARKWLVAHEWMRETGEVAADKYLKSSWGANTVKVFSVDAPKKGKVSLPSETVDTEPKGKETLPSASPDGSRVKKSHPPKTLPKVCSCLYGYCSACVASTLTTTPAVGGASVPTVGSKTKSLRDKGLETKTTPKPTTKIPASDVPVQVKRKHNPKYDEPFPDEFDSWSTLDRSVWCEAHKVRVADRLRPVVEAKLPAESPASVKRVVPVPNRESSAPVPTQKDSAPVVAPVVEATPEPVVRPPITPRPPASAEPNPADLDIYLPVKARLYGS